MLPLDPALCRVSLVQLFKVLFFCVFHCNTFRFSPCVFLVLLYLRMREAVGGGGS